jgi:hypothetical protein
MKKARPVSIMLYSGNQTESLENVDCYINTENRITAFLFIIGEIVHRYYL